MPFHQHVNNALIWGWCSSMVGVYCEVSQGVGLMLILILHYPSSSLFHYYPIHTPGVDTSNKSSTKKMVWEQNPIVMFFNPCPKTENNRTMRET